MNGSIISAALGLIKEKERQGDKAMDRLHDGMKTQMELTANQGSWTGDSKTPEKVKEKVVEKEKVKEPEENKQDAATPATPTATSSSADDDKEDIADMGIMQLAQGASK